MKSLKGTKTLNNLMKAFAGESQARNRYTFYAGIAKKEGLNNISNIFLEIAGQEKEHAEIFYKFLIEDNNGSAETITATFPISLYSTTKDNLIAARDGENEEYASIYPHFAEVAKEEGFPKIAYAFSTIALIEKHHRDRYQEIYNLIQTDKLFKKNDSVVWICSNCGHLHTGNEAPGICPVCHHGQGFFGTSS